MGKRIKKLIKSPVVFDHTKNLKSRNFALKKPHIEKTAFLTGRHRRDYLRQLVESQPQNQKEVVDWMVDSYGVQKMNLSHFEPDPQIVSMIPKMICEKYNVIALMKVEDTLIVACSDPGDTQFKEDLMMFVNHKLEIVAAEYNVIKRMIHNRHPGDADKIKRVFKVMSSSGLGKDTDNNESPVESKKMKKDPVVKTVNFIFEEGFRLGCSDIHIEVYENRFRVRYRVDGKLYEGVNPPLNSASAVISRVKVMSQLDISEKRRPQDGRLKIPYNGKIVDFRVSSAPVLHGEKIVLRVLDSSSLMTDTSKLGMEPEQARIFNKYLKMSQGLILITGPTGSGKTTTIYSGLMELNKPTVNISTAEDPVEYKIPGINQLQVNSKIGLTFASALRAFLRQDPDIILVGEIRDPETAGMAFRAANTGHLVLSTLHTTDSVSSITRLLDIGLPSYSVAENISVVIAQRLLRLLCKNCKTPDSVNTAVLMQLGFSEREAKAVAPHIMKAQGCGQCNHSGYAGRVAVYEMLEMSNTLKIAVFKNLSPRELKKIAIEEGGLSTLRVSGLKKLKQGLTSIDEVIYSTMEDN